MRVLIYAQLKDSLLSLSLQRGDGVLVHSALHFLGKPEGGAEMILRVLAEVLGISLEDSSPTASAGTLVVPTFNFAFARGEPFDRQNTPSVGMGVFSELVRRHPLAQRTPHPLQSVTALGRYAADLASRHTLGAFDPGSAFERMVELDFKILLLGADVQAISLLHYAEQRIGVPYRYWKEFRGPVRMDDKWEERAYRMYVRDLDLDPKVDLHPVQQRLAERGKWHSQAVNYGFISVCRMRDFVEAVEEFLREDPWSLVINRPSKS
ncbi:MAG: AAC(3) family N-acetyltransferase [Anaerolineales bacterium]|nr:AAC(3) family N-acetyltransferase [Anaerolineales bacterium]MDW8446368.1 AAC(3) family N-acetyltransferase [Anaerolineales bacterium]